MTNKVTVSDLQFNGQTDTEQKLRRLMDDLRTMQRALNNLLGTVDDLEVTAGEGGVEEHVLATLTGLGPEHTLQGMAEGMVLITNASDNALFRKLLLTDLDQTDLGSPAEDEVITFVDGYPTWAPIPEQTFTVDPSTINHGDLADLTQDDHPQYTQHAQEETISEPWVFEEDTDFEADISVGGNIEMGGEEPYIEMTDSLADADELGFQVQQSADRWRLQALNTEGDPSETAMEVSAVDGIVESIDFSGNEMRFNGGNVLTDYDDFTISGSWTFEYVIAAPGAVLDGDEPTITWTDTNAGSDELGFEQRQRADRWELNALNDAGDVSETALSISSVDGIVEAIDFTGNEMRFNGSDILAAESVSSSATAGAASLPATPEEFITVLIGGQQRKIPAYLP